MGRKVPTSLFFFKDLFLLFFIGKADIQRGEKERKIFRPMIHSPSERNRPILCRSEARSLFRVSHAGAGSQSFGLSSPAFPGHRQGAGREAGLPPLEPVPIWDPGLARQGPLTTCATVLGPHRDCYMEQVTSGIVIWSRLHQGPAARVKHVTSGILDRQGYLLYPAGYLRDRLLGGGRLPQGSL